jgi:hypothetical protein
VIGLVGMIMFWAAVAMAVLLTFDTIGSVLYIWIAQLAGAKLKVSVGKLLAVSAVTVAIDLAVAFAARYLS